MKPTVYLHVGSPKTGTTTLQNFLPDNKEILEKHGMTYPDFGFRYEGVGVRRNGHFLITTRHRDEQGRRILTKEKEDYETGLQKLKELSARFPRIILSDEGLWKQSLVDRKNFWETLKNDLDGMGMDMKIIVYFRRQDDFMQSHYAQKIKEGASYSFQEYLDKPFCAEYPLDYYAYLNMFKKIVGEENLIVRVFEKGQFLGEEHTIQSDFLQIFGLKMSDGFQMKQDVYNTSYQGNYLAIKKILNTLPQFRPSGNFLASEIRKVQAENPLPLKKTSFFAPGEQAKYMQQFEKTNALVAREYLHREDGKLFYRENVELPEFQTDAKELLQDVMLVYGKCIDTLYEQTRENKKKIDELDKKLKASEKKIRELEQTSFWFRLKRKTKHVLGKDRM